MFNLMKKDILIYIITSCLFLSLSIIILNSTIDYSYPITWIFSYLFNMNGNSIILGNYNIVINNFCSGLFSIGLYLSIIFSPMTKSGNRLQLAFYGSIFLYILNILRIAIILISSNYINPENIHNAGWIIMSLSIFIIWYNYGLDKKK